MKFDKRIKNITDIQSVINGNKGVIGKRGYFAENIVKFEDLSKCIYGVVNDYREDDKCFCHIRFFTNKANEPTWYPYFILEDDLNPKELEKKYRPFTGIEFAEKFNIKLNGIIYLRSVPTDDHYCYNYKVVFTGYRWCDNVFQVFLNGSWLDLPKLLELYEYKENGEWHKFGIEVTE